jgi:hypothetical protein
MLVGTWLEQGSLSVDYPAQVFPFQDDTEGKVLQDN